ncbi:MAG: diaminopimelate dehydrogenase [Clostridiales bacterium]|nr:diaminopimelate dehydrogenase [Clostridiales bacterium]
MSKIRVAIAGYGNIGRGVELAIQQNPDMTPVSIFTRRDPAGIKTATGIPVFSLDNVADYTDKIDVMIICGGSATDLPVLTPKLAGLFNTVDSFDTHAKIPEQFARVDKAAKAGGHLALISSGWDPGLFSINRVCAEAVLPAGSSYTFWGRGVSQGHSDALRRVNGVKDAKQYTVPVPAAMDAVRSGSNPELSTRDKHTRECFVVAEEGADLSRIEREIKEMPNYFADYDTTVTFISEEELKREHSAIPHGGFVIRSGESAAGNKSIIEYSLKLDSNPEFTSSVLVASARAVAKMAAEGKTGCITMFDIPPALLSPKSPEELRASLL